MTLYNNSNIRDMAFTHKDLTTSFEGVRKGKTVGMYQACYVFSSVKGDYLEVYAGGGKEFRNEIRILVDNFPAQRRSYSTNIPFRTIDDFEEILKRIKVEVPKRLDKRKCDSCENELPLSYFKKENQRCVTCQ